MKNFLFYIIFAFLLGGVFTYSMIDKNYNDFTTPKVSFSKNLSVCEEIGQKVQHIKVNPFNISTVDQKLNGSREYFKCVQAVYGYDKYIRR